MVSLPVYYYYLLFITYLDVFLYIFIATTNNSTVFILLLSVYYLLVYCLSKIRLLPVNNLSTLQLINLTMTATRSTTVFYFIVLHSIPIF